MSETKTFTSLDEVLRFFEDQISRSNQRISELELSNRAYESLFKWLIAILQNQDGQTNDVLIRMLDAWRNLPPDGSSDATEAAFEAINEKIEKILIPTQDKPTLSVIDGGKKP